jgi:hypothetical protein
MQQERHAKGWQKESFIKKISKEILEEGKFLHLKFMPCDNDSDERR